MRNEAAIRAPGKPVIVTGIVADAAPQARRNPMAVDLPPEIPTVTVAQRAQVHQLPTPAFGQKTNGARLARMPVGHHSNWRTSIADTMALLGMDASLPGRRSLAKKLGHAGKLDGSTTMNMWLHKTILSMSGRPGTEDGSKRTTRRAVVAFTSNTFATEPQRGMADAIPAPSDPVPPANDKPSATAGMDSGKTSPELPAPPPAQRINPTKRTLRFVVPVSDGPSYLGDANLAVAPDDSLSVQAERMLQMLEPLLKPEVFAHLKSSVGSGTEITAIQLGTERITLNYDSERLALAIRIPVEARRNSALSLRGTATSNVQTLQPAGFSGFVNLRSSLDVVERGADRGVTAPVSLVDGAVRAFGVVAEGEGYLSLRSDERFFRRTGSRLVYDDLKDVIRFTVGDVQPFARSFQGTPTVAGISAQRLYNVLEPWREYRSTGSQGFTIFAPSTVETIVNGRSVERKMLQPGSYTLQDFPLADGANNVKLLIQDEAGKQRTIDFNLYSNRALLVPGVTEFSVLAGVYSNPTTAGVAYTRDWAASGFVRWGISQQFTAGLNMQADRDAQQIGGEMLLGTGIGLIGFDLAASRSTAGGNGIAAVASYEKIVQSNSATRSMSLHALVEYRSPDFAVPGTLIAREPLAFRTSAGWSMTLGRDTYLSADAQYSRDRVQRIDTIGLHLGGGIGISQSLALIGDVEWDKSRENRRGFVRIGLRKRIGSRSLAQTDVDTRGTARASYQTSHGSGVGSWSGSVDIDRNNDGTNVNAQASLLTNRFDLGLTQFGGYSNDGNGISDMRTSFRVGTSIAFADGAFALGRPIQQAFLIAEPHRSLHGNAVSVDPQEKSEQARSGALGGAVDGALSAYSPRTVVYEVPGAPPGYDLGAGNVQIAPPYKAGYFLEIGSDYHLLVIGRLLDSNGEPISLLAGKATDLKAPKRPAITMFTSRGGKFAAQGLRPGKWQIRMPTEPKPTIYEIDIKDDPSGTVRLGDIRPLDRGDAK